MYRNNSINTVDNSSHDTLNDKTSAGKVRPWKEKKIANVGYYELLHILNFKKANRVGDCANVLEFKSDEEGKLTLYKTWFCKSPLCPMCNWRRAMKHSYQTEKIVSEVIRRKPKARWLFLTLSIRNAIDGQQLDESLKQMAIGFNRLFKYKKVKKNLVGFMRATEVTVNHQDLTYNQHMHVLVCVESVYFRDSTNYISQKQWTSLWKKAMKLNYEPMVDVRAIKPKNKDKTDIKSAIDETAKYPVKDTDYLTEDDQKNMEVVRDLEAGLYRKRRIAYGGLLKEIHKEMNLDDSEDGDLVKTSEEEKEVEEDAYTVVAQWNFERQNYFVKNKS